MNHMYKNILVFVALLALPGVSLAQSADGSVIDPTAPPADSSTGGGSVPVVKPVTGTTPVDPASSGTAAPASGSVGSVATPPSPDTAVSSPATSRPGTSSGTGSAKPSPTSAPATGNTAPQTISLGTVNMSVTMENDAGSSKTPWWLLIIAGVVVGAGVILKLVRKAKYTPASTQGKEEKKEDGGRCFDLKKMMEDKLKELTDLEGQLKSKVKDEIKSGVKEAIAGTTAGELVEKVETAKKAYEKIKALYEKCMIDFEHPKRVFVVHGWDGHPDEGWFPWIKDALVGKGLHVEVPAMPNPSEPTIDAWVAHLAKTVGEVDENTFFVGHSIGCQAILRYLETLPEDKKVGGAVFVAGWFTLTNSETDKEKRIGKPWLETPIDFEKVKKHTSNFSAIFSDDDDVVPLENKTFFEERLGAQTIIEHGKGHFSGSDEVRELPSALEHLLAVAEPKKPDEEKRV